MAKFKLTLLISNAPILVMMPYRLTMSTYNGGLDGEVQTILFKKNGKPVLKRSIEELESFVNTLSNAIVDAAKGKADTEEWLLFLFLI